MLPFFVNLCPEIDDNIYMGNRHVLILITLLLTSCSGVKKEIDFESSIGDAVVGDGGGTRTDGANLGSIYTVYKVVEAGAGIPGWTNAEMPLGGTYTPIALGVETQNRQTPFHFTYTYPPNNYKLAEAHIIINTKRDNSDTEGIFVDGVMTGIFPNDAPSTSSRITHRYYTCQTSCTTGGAPSTPANKYYMSWSLSHYKSNSSLASAPKQTVDLRLSDLLSPTTVQEKDVLNDGQVNVVTGDDSPIYSAYLIYQGVTISKNALTCTNSSTYNFENTYVHNDGNSISTPAFNGVVKAPYTSWSGARDVAGQTVEFYFDPRLPTVSSQSNITLTNGTITMTVKRAATGSSAIVINGVGIAQAGFDKTTATSVVESWNENSAVVAAWESFVNAIPATETGTAVTLDLVSILGAGTVRDLISQGKFNIALSGSLAIVSAANNSSARTYGTQVAGPELYLKGTFFTQNCEVPDNPDSPLSDDNPVPSGGLDETSPLVSSVQAAQITSNSAVIQWLTDEGADTTVEFGLTDPPTDTTATDTTMKTFHSVTLTGLSPFKYYFYRVKSKDSSGNETIYSTKVFRTLR